MLLRTPGSDYQGKRLILPSRNLIINGAMEHDQRNSGAAVTATGSYPVDRFFCGFSNDGALSWQQSTTVPTGSRFKNSIKFTATTADATVGSVQWSLLRYRVEGTDFQHLMYGTARALTSTLSFWVRSAVTGTYGVNFWNSAQDRSYTAAYTINAVDTWEYKTLVIPGDTSGTWLTTTGIGLEINWSLMAGSSVAGAAGAWGSTAMFGVTGQANVYATINNTFYITGVQFEVGAGATLFERRFYGHEEGLCRRYFVTLDSSSSGNFGSGVCYATTTAFISINLPVRMRNAPSLSVASAASDFTLLVGSGSLVPSAIVMSGSGQDCARLELTLSGATAGQGAVMYGNSSAKLKFAAEL